MLRSFALHLLANIAAIVAVDYFVADFCVLPAVAETCPDGLAGGVLAYAVAGLGLGLLNFFIKPVLKLIAMPLTFMTAGLFVFVINAVVLGLLVWLVKTLALTDVAIVVGGASVWVTYLYAAVILGLFNLGTHWLVKD